MSLPSGLIFFLDFIFGDVTNDRLGETKDTSIYGQGVKGSQLTGGVNLNSANIDKQPYAFASAYGSPTGSTAAVLAAVTNDMQGNSLNITVNGTAKLGDQLAVDAG